ncbi:MAG TPA: hypothetical protein DCZ75_03505 [Geobacter sp.]|nr:hypothetical protein [Geobacter sp.]
MSEKTEQIAALAAKSSDIADTLDQVLVGPNDRAYVVCSYDDCRLYLKGRCTIYTVLDVPRMKTGQPCSSYEKYQAPES